MYVSRAAESLHTSFIIKPEQDSTVSFQFFFIFVYRCRSSNDCLGFILDYAKSSCFKVRNIDGFQENLIPFSGVAYFSKICIPRKY